MKRALQHVFASLCSTLLIAATLFGCGGSGNPVAGGVGEGGTGTGPSSATGTVTGFGSVIVEGVRWDDSAALVQADIDPRAAPMRTVVKLGERVGIQYSSPGQADVVSVEPEVVAPISAISIAADVLEFTAAGQTIRSNMMAHAGPLTVFDGVELPTDLRVGDVVEVHGARRIDPASGGQTVVAARVQRLAALPSGLVRVSGIVEALSTGSSTFRVGGVAIKAATATIQPAGRRLTNGQRVAVWGRPLSRSSGLEATVVRVRDGDATFAAQVELSGFVARLDPATREFHLGGTRIDARSATVAPASAVLADNGYVLILGTKLPNGIIVAKRIDVRSAIASAGYVDLSGEVTDYERLDRFKVRDTRIDASRVLALTNCPNNRIGNRSAVNVLGVIRGSRVEAVQLQCTNSGSVSLVEVKGVATQVSIVNRTFKLTPNGKPARDVSWGQLTKFDDVSPSTLEGRRVEVTGTNDAVTGSLLAVNISD